MRLRSGGIDIFYIDESEDANVHVMSAVAVPFLRPGADGDFEIVWDSYLEEFKEWRREIKGRFRIPTKYELHGNKLVRGKGRPKDGKWNFKSWEARRAYAGILELVDFLPEKSILSVAGDSNSQLYGATRLEAVLTALFQRMRSQCNARNVNALVFFDDGHPEYRRYYRKAQVYLPTGSARGAWWGGGATKNLPLNMFTKDGNQKVSAHCFMTQLADLVAYSCFLKRKGELGLLEPWQEAANVNRLYDNVPIQVLNILVSANRDGIKRL